MMVVEGRLGRGLLCLLGLGFLLCSGAQHPQEPLLDPQEPLLDPQEPPLDPQEGLWDPQEVPSVPQEGLWDPQEVPSDPQEGLWDPQEVPSDLQEVPSDPQEVPWDPQEVPSDPQEGLWDPQEVPSDPQEGLWDPQEVPSDPQEGLWDPQEVPSDPQEGLWDPQEGLWDPQEVPSGERGAAFQPQSALSDMEFASVVTYRGPGNSDVRGNKELPIILWWSGGLFPHFPGDTERIDCAASSCMATRNRKVQLHKRTAAVVFYGTDFRAYEAPLPRPPHQTWALFHEESPMNNYVLSHAPAIRLFNYTATFRRGSDYPLTLQWLPSLPYLLRPVAVTTAEKNRWRGRGLAPVLYMQSHCDVPSDRDRYVRELMKYIEVDSYGKCLNNKALPPPLDDTATATGEDPRFMAFTARYKFHLALENGRCHDYVTEKLWRPLHQGCVPVYRGSASVADWLPAGRRSAVLVDDFPSPRDLARFLTSLDEDDAEYAKYLEFKRPGAIANARLLEALASREWGVNDMSRPNYLNGFECYVCDRENARLAAERAYRKAPERSGPPPRPKMADGSHMGCPMPSPGYGDVEDLPPDDSWLQMWPQDYWQSLDQAEGLESLIRHNESDPALLWSHIQQLVTRRARGL